MKLRIFCLLVMSLGLAASAQAESPAMDADVPAAREPAGNIDDDLKKLKEAAANKDEQAVVAAATRVLGVDSKNLRALNALAVYYYNQGKFGLSRLLILRALNDHPNVPALQNNMGVLFLSEGKQKQAMGSFRKALEMKSNYAPAACNLGAIYLEYRDYKKAVDVLSIGYDTYRSDLRRGSAYAYDVASNYAVALSGAGDLDSSKSVFKNLLRADDQNPWVLYNYAVLLIGRNKDKSEGKRIIAKLKLLADSNLTKKVDELERML